MSPTLNEMLNAAIDADNKGVPVDWKNLAFTIYNAASLRITELEREKQQTATQK